MRDRFPATSERLRGPAGIAKRSRLAAVLEEEPIASADPRIDALGQFDAEAWIALLAEHRLRIAKAAGVDPSRVKIQLGHC